MLRPLEPFRDKLLTVGGLDGVADQGHPAIGEVFTGWGVPDEDTWAGGASIDQMVASARSERSLVLGAALGGRRPLSRAFYSGAGSPVDPEVNPVTAFSRVFGNVSSETTSAAMSDAQRKQKSVLDVWAGQYSSLRRQLPAADRHKMDAHLDGIRALEERIQAQPLLTCDASSSIVGLDKDSSFYRENANYPTVMRLQIDVMVQALACQATSVGALQFGNSGGRIIPYWPDEGLSITKGYHEISHDFGANEDDTGSIRANRLAIETWLTKQFAYLLRRLSEVPEGEGTLLDNTMVLWGKAMGFRHKNSDRFSMVVGGGIEGGRHIEVNSGTYNNDLLTGCCQHLGYNVKAIGEPDANRTPIAL